LCQASKTPFGCHKTRQAFGATSFCPDNLVSSLSMSFRLDFKKARGLIILLIIIGVAFGGGYYFGVQGYRANITRELQVSFNREAPPDVDVDMSLFWTVWKDLNDNYYDKTKLDPNKMVYGAISGMVNSLGDPFTMFLPPDQNQTVNEDLSGSFSGVGIQIGFDKNGSLMVQAPLPGSPAESAGVKAGDYIARIKDVKKNIDVDTSGIALGDAVSDIRGPVGTTVTLTLVRAGVSTPIVVNIVRATLNVPSVVLTYVGNNNKIADLKINSFDANTPDEWNKAVDQVVARGGVTGVIVDLRDNPGGYLQDAVDITSDFVKTGTVVVIEQDGNGSKIDYKSDKVGKLLGLPVVVLINGGSASASEIMTGALQDDIHAKTVGTKSFGKGTVQEPIDITGGAGLHVTVAKWLTPNGTWVHGVGITPDYVIDNPSATQDAQLQKAESLFQ
jgi:carboxyl-terminal processing protease